MIKVTEPYPANIITLFDEFAHNRPVIYSVFEGQYEGCVYVDNTDEAGYALLFTPFMFCYAAGNPYMIGIESELEELIFNQILRSSDQKEIVVFSPSVAWHPVLKRIFDKHNGLADGRKLFEFDPDKFGEAKKKYGKLPDGFTSCICDVSDDPLSRIPYPAARLFHYDACVSSCSAIMLGSGQAELDISTHADYQGKGYATFTAITLIEELLKRNLKPAWSTWPYRQASQAVALKAGFARSADTLAFIWTESDCGKL